MNGDPTFRGGRRIITVAGAFAIVGLLALIGGIFADVQRFFGAYLIAYIYVLTIACGALVFLMIVHAMRAGWPTLLRRLIEAMVATFPLLAVLFVPIPIGLAALYPWMRIDTIPSLAARELVARKVAYLNAPGFILRAVVYFVVWILVGHLLRRASLQKDREPEIEVNHRMYVTSGILLPLVALALSFASFDWVMSLMPTWYSSMFPVYFFAGGFLGALALLTLLTAVADANAAILGITSSHYYALGRLLLAFTIFWAYVAFFQLMLIWIANRPDEVTFYLARVAGGWRAVTVLLAATHFVVPFFVLLNYDIKRRRGPLALVAAWLLVAHYIDVEWLVMPSLRPFGAVYSWIDLGAIFFVGGVTVVYATLRLRGLSLVPIHDPSLPRALRYESV
jgi:hypothetical protein